METVITFWYAPYGLFASIFW